jgi:thiol-disulfide isomerase/thioredoxin
MSIRFFLVFIAIYISCSSLQGQELNIQDDYFRLEEIKRDTSNKRDSISKLYKIYFDKISKANDTLIKNDLQNKINDLDVFSEQNNSRETSLEFDFVKQNPSSFVSLDLLLYRLQRREGMKLYDTFNSLYNSLAIEIRNSEKGELMRKKLTDFKNSSVGNLAPDFTLKDINGNQFTLSSFGNKKYILIDFWASWCAPCRQDFPFLKEIYNKYNVMGFDIINISTDENIDSWRKAIVNDNIGMWKHFSIKENVSSIEDLYFVTAIPVKILINNDGVIIGRWRGGGEENKAELKKNLNEIFNK